MAEPSTQKLKRKKESGGVIGLHIAMAEPSTQKLKNVEVLDERCIVCTMDVRCWRHAYTGGSVVVVGGASGAEVEKVSGVIGLGVRSGNKLAGCVRTGNKYAGGTTTPTKKSIEEEGKKLN
jgi:hypothetical protein